jgi:hypothetical protein
MKPDGTFLVRGLIGERCLRLADVPAGWHVKDAIHQGLDLANRVIRFEPGDVYADVTIRIERGTARDPQSDCEP